MNQDLIQGMKNMESWDGITERIGTGVTKEQIEWHWWNVVNYANFHKRPWERNEDETIVKLRAIGSSYQSITEALYKRSKKQVESRHRTLKSNKPKYNSLLAADEKDADRGVAGASPIWDPPDDAPTDDEPDESEDASGTDLALITRMRSLPYLEELQRTWNQFFGSAAE